MSRFAIALLLALLYACNMQVGEPPLEVPEVASLPTVTAVSTPLPFEADNPYQDASAIMEGVCFNYWIEQVNRVFVIGSAQEHIRFYNDVDESELCRFPVDRHPFDFTGRIMVGAVNVGTGCQAITEPLALVTDAANQTVTLRVGWGVTGECDYRLVRPFWVSIARPPEGYRVQMDFVPAG